MKNKIIFLSLIASFLSIQTEAQNRSSVNAMSNEISDNLDLRAVASIFGESRNLEDFERRLNDPELQISNLDLNNDNEVDYLRVIETVEYNTHVVIIQSVLDRDVYQDVATIDIERNNNSVQVQFIGNEYMYGPNYIYEPVYYSTPLIYASFWATNYRPYVSNWYWNYYPSYYYAWRPYPIYRYRNNINLCVNFNNYYNYVSYRRSNIAISIYNTRRANAYERRYPNYAFSKRYSNYSNRYELDQRRGSRYSNYNPGRNTTGRQYNAPQRRETQRDYTQNRANTSSSRQNTTRDYTNNRIADSKQNAPSRNYNQNNNINSNRENNSSKATNRTFNNNNNSNNYSRGNTSQNRSDRTYNQNNSANSRQNASPQQSPSTRSYAPRQESSSQRAAQSPRDNSQNRGTFSRPSTPAAAPQRAEAGRSRSSNQENNNSSRNNNRRI
ncbi:hypothetical protein GCM10008015_16090 [Flavobacterium palustre]|uniref:DUF3300 domain-containing protein n=1 Tax=Flavobacterium palustre TaxID=1476463 RepID=A0ABQ1HHG3_9FLAO|nr:hypothetical protein [Flavobacterium palustre]GGA76267.1 hypothetical protein GCM10008015_16090 [Flavobacterium palustre]